MKFKSLMLAAVLALCATGAANAGTFWVGPSAGISVPTGDFGDAAKLGFNAGVTGTYMMDATWGVGADVAYHMWNAKDEINDALNILLGTTDAEAKFSAIQYTAHVLWTAPTQSSVKPYAKLGVGGYNVKTKITSSAGDADDSENKVGFNLGTGIMFMSSANMGFGVGAAYHMINTKDDATGATNTNVIIGSAKVVWGFGSK